MYYSFIYRIAISFITSLIVVILSYSSIRILLLSYITILVIRRYINRPSLAAYTRERSSALVVNIVIVSYLLAY